MVDDAVKMVISCRTKEGHDVVRWQERITNHFKWLTNHTLKEVRAGQVVDALDTEYIWCKAIIDLKINTGKDKAMLLIHYDGWSRKYDELLSEDSFRLAPKGFYTNREDIPRYKRCDSRNVPMNNA